MNTNERIKELEDRLFEVKNTAEWALAWWITAGFIGIIVVIAFAVEGLWCYTHH